MNTNNYPFFPRLLVVLTVLVFVLSACAAPTPTPVAVMNSSSSGMGHGMHPTSDPNVEMPVLPMSVSVQEAKEMYDNGAFVLDVREKDEWNTGHIQGAMSAPLGEIEMHFSHLPKDRPVLVICRSGNRSQAGRDILREQGFTNATSVDGGMLDWIANGYPVTTGK